MYVGGGGARGKGGRGGEVEKRLEREEDGVLEGFAAFDEGGVVEGCGEVGGVGGAEVLGEGGEEVWWEGGSEMISEI